MDDKLALILEENDFIIREYETEYELETWTNGGVNMLKYIDKNRDFIKEFASYAENFDIDEEIEVHRQNKQYRDDFTITESLKDFKDYKKLLKKISKKLMEVLK